MNKKIITQQGYFSLQKKIIELKKELNNLATELNLARDGDISENHPFLALREKMEVYQLKIMKLQELLEKSEIKDKNKNNSSVIELGNIVTWQRLEEGKEKVSMEITDEIEADPLQGKISAVSPLGIFLIGKKVGDILEVKRDKVKYQIQILAIK